MQKGRLRGYGVIRPCRAGYKIAPLFADTPESAEALFAVLRSKAKPSEAIFLDTPEVNPAAVVLAKRYDMKPMFETARMYKRKIPEIPLDLLIAI